MSSYPNKILPQPFSIYPTVTLPPLSCSSDISLLSSSLPLTNLSFYHSIGSESQNSSLPTETDLDGLIESQVEEESDPINSSKQNRCPECGLYFKNLKGMRQHMGKVHSNPTDIYHCTICMKEFKNKQAVKYHVKQVHDKSTRVKCPVCQTEIYNKYMLKKHLLKHAS
jgi:hypothetical protein